MTDIDVTVRELAEVQRQFADLDEELTDDELRTELAELDERGPRWRFGLLPGLLIVVAVMAAGCGADRSAAASMPDAAEAARLTADALSRSCAYECSTLRVYIQTDLVSQHTRAGTMEEPTVSALSERFPDARFVDSEEADGLFGPDFLVDSGRGVLVTVGPVERLADDVVGVEVGVYTARDGAHGEVVQYQWTDEDWRHATSEDTGVTVTTWVS